MLEKLLLFILILLNLTIAFSFYGDVHILFTILNIGVAGYVGSVLLKISTD